MTNKIDNGPTAPARLDGFTVLEAEGAEAGAFLQAQCMNDVAALATGQWQWNGWLSPKGRLIALFALLRADAQRFLLVLPDYPADVLRGQLQRYVFRSKLKLASDTPWRIAGVFGRHAGQREGHWSMDLSDETQARTLLVLPADVMPSAGPPALYDAWLATDIAQGLPRLGPEQVERWTPQMLSLERFAAYSLKKGCYPGQEIVARTHYLGQAKRGLVRIAGDGLAAGAPLSEVPGGASIGEIVSATRDGRGALAVVSLDKAEAGLWCGTTPATRLALGVSQVA